MHEPGTKLYTLWRKQRRLRVQLAVVVAIVLCLVLWLKPHVFPTTAASKETGSTSSGTPKLTKGTPNFRTFVPAGKTIDSYGGWTRVSPSTSAAVYAYSDTLGGTAIIVSEQELPAPFKTDEKKEVQKLQTDQNYTTQHTLKVGDTTVYVGASPKNYQSTIFVKDGVLVLITSYRVINDTTVSTYVQSLE